MTPREKLNSPEWAQYILDNPVYKINLQQIVKTPEVTDILVAPKGYSFVTLDFDSAEPHVIAEFSKDPKYSELYASGKPHDAYLYVMCMLVPTPELLESYQIENVTSETVARTKKKFKNIRSIGKVLQLMSIYKASANTIYRKLRLFGVDITKEEVVTLHKDFWSDKLFSKVLEFEESLKAEVDQREGYLVNAFNRPQVITDKKRKDCLNVYGQGSAHDALDILIRIIEKNLGKYNIEANPIIPDYHDETIWICETAAAHRVADVMILSLKELNDILGWSIKMKGDPEITDNFTKFKGPDPVEYYTKRLAEINE